MKFSEIYFVSFEQSWPIALIRIHFNTVFLCVTLFNTAGKNSALIKFFLKVP